MNISLKRLHELTEFEYSLPELDVILTGLGIEVEGVINYKEKYDKFFVAEVLTCVKHPKADKLSVCEVSIGSETLDIVCGAPNVAAGQKVILGVNGAIVPNGGYKLEKRKIRDVESNGMICSVVELDLGEAADGIWVLPETAVPGTPVAEFLNMDDVILEIGLTPNKADCLSHFGIARELAAYTKKDVLKPAVELNEGSESTDSAIHVLIEDEELCPRYCARVIKGVKIVESPEYIKNYLTKIGLRPINAIVDVTNYILHDLGQPLHAFDYDKIADSKIVVKPAAQGDKFITLDGKERILEEKALLICDGEKPVAIAGVMGGQNSEITDASVNVLLESAYFNPSSVRRTAKKLGLSSDASYRFERGTDIENVDYAIDLAAKMISEICGGVVLSEKVDVYPTPYVNPQIALRFQKARDIIGIDITNENMVEILEALKFPIVTKDDLQVIVEVPHRRNDVYGEIDLIEEVARLYNYDNITPDFTSSIDFGGDGVSKELAAPKFRNQIREYFRANGYNEILTQNMTDPESAKLFSDDPVIIANPLGEELSIMTPSILPNLMKIISFNIRKGNKSLGLFEIAKSFNKTDADNTFISGLEEREHLAVALVGKSSPLQWGDKERVVDFYDIKGVAEDFAKYFRYGKFKLAASEADSAYSKNSLAIQIKGKKIGKLGEINKDLLKKFDIDTPVYVMEIDLKELADVNPDEAKYSPVAPYPGSSRDLAFLVDSTLKAEEIKREIAAKGGKLLKSVEVFDVYEGKNLPAGKRSLAFNMYFAAPDRTLVEDEVENAVNSVIAAIEKKFAAELRK